MRGGVRWQLCLAVSAVNRFPVRPQDAPTVVRHPFQRASRQSYRLCLRLTAAEECESSCFFGLFGVLLLIGAALGVGKTSSLPSVGSTNTEISAPPAKSCKNDWRLCSNNADLVNNYSAWYKVQAGCKTAAKNAARYGSPEFPWFSFGSFKPGKDYPQTGLVTSIEKDAQFSNGFGAMVHSTVVCTYDLATEIVTKVSVQPY